MFNLGMPELIVVLLILLLVFGASKIPQIGEGLGKAIRGFKRGLSDDSSTDRSTKPRDQDDDRRP
jgi:sec-independent protein translocase protein TatA